MTSTHESPLKAKIRKLMAKASDPSVTEAEAAAFAVKVQELLLQSGLAMSDIGASTEERREQVGEQSFDFSRWNSPHRRGLLDTVCSYYMCEVLYWRHQKRMVILGKPQNVEIAASMTDYLISTVVRLSTRYGREHPGSNVVDFRRGCMLRLRERLMEEKAKMERAATTTNPGNLPVLFVSEGALVRQYVEAKYKVRKTKARAIKHGADAWAGRAAAEGISLRPQVGAAASNRQLTGGRR